VQRDRLLFGLAAVLAGIATLEFVLAFVYTPVLLAIAIPFAAAAYFVWYQASGRLRERVESGRAGSYAPSGLGDRFGLGRGPEGDARRRTRRRDDSEMGGFGAGPRESYSNRRGGFDADRDGFGFGDRFGVGRGSSAGRGPDGGRRRTNAGSAQGVGQNAGPTPAEAYRVLGLDADATADEVRRAYRERVKSVHPDRDGGDEAEFKRVTEAYEVLKERA
jgi:hypothetical protein